PLKIPLAIGSTGRYSIQFQTPIPCLLRSCDRYITTHHQPSPAVTTGTQTMILELAGLIEAITGFAQG
ncbi:hypothetical protein, partial [Prochlorothrix hollandica]|uniref:hypothetical protein n=1 Tax=Prochlorothrix hollandica TaxID=1223 RepID=UPI003342078A